jgi:hypothetical protein
MGLAGRQKIGGARIAPLSAPGRRPFRNGFRPGFGHLMHVLERLARELGGERVGVPQHRDQQPDPLNFLGV